MERKIIRKDIKIKKNLIFPVLSIVLILAMILPYTAQKSGFSMGYLGREVLSEEYAEEFPPSSSSLLKTAENGDKQYFYYEIGDNITLPEPLEYIQTVADVEIPKSSDEMRGVWIPYLSLSGINQTTIDGMVERVKNIGLNTVFLHVRPFGDALYKSQYFPWSHLITGTQGQEPANGFDPLEYAIKKCHENGISLHAWINPLRVRSGTSTPKELAANNPAVTAMAENSGRIINCNDSLYYNPADAQNVSLIVDGVIEICKNYDIDGIHFDDYFYPENAEGFDDSSYYNSYVSSGGDKSLSDWRKDNISNMVKKVYSAIKAVDSSIVFGISPAGNMSKCEAVGADVKLWCSQSGYVDYICPQIYWPVGHSTHSFDKCAADWKNIVTNENVKFYIGLALYKAGSDSDNGLWLKSTSNIADQVRSLRASPINADGFSLYSYAYLSNTQTAQEVKNFTYCVTK